ncbi:hypothetical protein RHMOL_Rhmol07G0280500 [Rhododendron molle]|uniref:Uncharacterized protein n=1 Tax=Rhododendron molle TaxID=49168 RepID=A0ACC0N7N4_RHOML|nr:hypothetical protein RHMOL_Rhmol07G0280500 [Rhododendron molle]
MVVHTLFLRRDIMRNPSDISERKTLYYLETAQGGPRTACLPSTLMAHNTVVKFVYFNVYGPELRTSNYQSTSTAMAILSDGDLNRDFDKVSGDLKFDGDGVSRDFKLVITVIF